MPIMNLYGNEGMLVGSYYIQSMEACCGAYNVGVFSPMKIPDAFGATQEKYNESYFPFIQTLTDTFRRASGQVIFYQGYDPEGTYSNKFYTRAVHDGLAKAGWQLLGNFPGNHGDYLMETWQLIVRPEKFKKQLAARETNAQAA
jgi:hypothetical protein